MTDMKGKVCLVTGATNGIGQVTAHELAALGATVIVVGRSQERGEQVVRAIRSQTGSDQVALMTADLSSQAEVLRLAATFRQQYPRLDVLVNNAGAIFLSRQESVDGIEMTFALNHLSYFLLTMLLLDMIKASAPARIVNVSSSAHEMTGGRFNFNGVTNKRPYLGWVAYNQSKLANILFTYELARRLEGTGVTVNALHPGFVRTGFGHNNILLMRAVMRGLQAFALSPEEGARTSIYLASSPDVAGVSGQYFVASKPVRSVKGSYDEEAARRLWALSERMTTIDAGVAV